MIKTLAKQIKEFKAASIATPLFMILEVLMEMIIPYLMASIIDKGVNTGDIHHIYKVGGIMVVAAVIGLFAGMMGGRFGAKHRRDLQGTYERLCLTIFRHFHFQILINSAQRDL